MGRVVDNGLMELYIQNGDSECMYELSVDKKDNMEDK